MNEDLKKYSKCKTFSSKSNFFKDITKKDSYNLLAKFAVKSNILKLHDKCPNPNSGCQKIINFTPYQYMLEGGSIKSRLEKIFRRTKKAWDSFIRPGLKMATPLISAAVAAKTKNPQSAQITNSILKSLTGGKFLSLADMHGHGLRLKVM